MRNTLDTNGLTGPQAIAARELLIGRSITTAAEKAGVQRQTVSGWVNEPGPFQRALRELQRQPLIEASEGLRRLAVSAVAALSAVLNDPDTPPGVKVMAAVQVLRACGAGMGQDAQQLERTGMGRELPEDLTIEELRALAGLGSDGGSAEQAEPASPLEHPSLMRALELS